MTADVTRRAAAFGPALALWASTARARSSPLRLTARPGAGPGNAAGTRRLGDAGLLFVPARAAGAAPAPLLVMLHGTDHDDRSGLELVRYAAEQAGVMVFAPGSRGSTWRLDAAETARLDRALQTAFAACTADPARIALAGFSAGASMALSWGLSNGDLFSGVAAFSAGGLSVPEAVGKPAVFMAHGDADRMLRFADAEAIAAELQARGYAVRFERFRGGHEVPPAMVRAALAALFPQALVSMASPPATPALA